LAKKGKRGAGKGKKRGEDGMEREGKKEGEPVAVFPVEKEEERKGRLGRIGEWIGKKVKIVKR
jgi:hypothetical protein